MISTLFDAKDGPDPNCKRCDGTGTYMYDHNHGKICEACCPHDKGWWLLSEGYAGYVEGEDTECCTRGCGFTRKQVTA